MKILFVAPEAAPLAKEGGLGDVVGALPPHLEALGHDVRLVLPQYRGLRTTQPPRRREEILFVHTGVGVQFAAVAETELPGSKVPVYLLEYQEYFDRAGIYHTREGAYPDNHRRFGLLSRGALELCLVLGWIPDVVHVHDWTTALIPAYLNTILSGTPLGQTASVLTIHNLEHQGRFPVETFPDTGLPGWTLRPDGFGDVGAANWLKGGLYHADKLTTVSPTYAEEIKGPVGGCGLDGVLRFKAADLIGIVNGIDEAAWDPATDPHLPAPISADDLSGRTVAREALREEFGLDPDLSRPLFGVVSRLFAQKGMDLFLDIMDRFLGSTRAQFVLLGSGDSLEEERFAAEARARPREVGVYLGYNERLAHLIMGGADFLVMPSRFEPCGLSQQYAMRYGAIPVVRKTGGLADTVLPAEEPHGTGFLFEPILSEALLEVLLRAVDLWETEPTRVAALQQNGMRRDASWGASARQYSQVYEWAAAARRG